MQDGLVLIGCPPNSDIETLTHNVLCDPVCPFIRGDISDIHFAVTLGGRTDLVFVFKESVDRSSYDDWRLSVGGCLKLGDYLMASHYDPVEETWFEAFRKVQRTGANLALPKTRKQTGLTADQYSHVLVNFKALKLKYWNKYCEK